VRCVRGMSIRWVLESLVPRAPSSSRVRRTPLRFEGRVEPGTMGHSALGPTSILVETRRGLRISPTSRARSKPLRRPHALRLEAMRSWLALDERADHRARRSKRFDTFAAREGAASRRTARELPPWNYSRDVQSLRCWSASAADQRSLEHGQPETLLGVELGLHDLADQRLTAAASRRRTTCLRHGPERVLTRTHATPDLPVGNSPTMTHYHSVLCPLALSPFEQKPSHMITIFNRQSTLHGQELEITRLFAFTRSGEFSFLEVFRQIGHRAKHRKGTLRGIRAHPAHTLENRSRLRATGDGSRL
jgi:hypothetical protein